MRSILLVSCNESTKVVQKKGVREIFNLKLTKNHKFFAKYPLAIPIIHANHPPRLYRKVCYLQYEIIGQLIVCHLQFKVFSLVLIVQPAEADE